jgi:hypothetical protein
MTTQVVLAGNRQVPIEVVSPVAQASANAAAVVTGCELDARGWNALSYTIKVITNAVDWVVYGANSSDYSDEVEVQAEATVAASGVGSYSVSLPPFLYYRVKIHSHVADTHGTATVVGVCKCG